MKILFAIFILTIWASLNLAEAAKKDECDKNVFDNCANRLLMLSDETFVFPNDTKQMNIRCKEVKTLERCTKDYSKNCLKGETKNSISVLMVCFFYLKFLFNLNIFPYHYQYGISKANKGYCVNRKQKNVFIGLGKCLNTHKKHLAKLLGQMNRDFHGIKSYQDGKLRIPLACW